MRKPRVYPLEINASIRSEGAWLSKGHHDPAEFCAAALREWGTIRFGGGNAGGTVRAVIDVPPLPECVEHLWGRLCPDATGEYHMALVAATPHSRGAFPYTECSAWDCLRKITPPEPKPQEGVGS